MPEPSPPPPASVAGAAKEATVPHTPAPSIKWQTLLMHRIIDCICPGIGVMLTCFLMVKHKAELDKYHEARKAREEREAAAANSGDSVGVAVGKVVVDRAKSAAKSYAISTAKSCAKSCVYRCLDTCPCCPGLGTCIEIHEMACCPDGDIVQGATFLVKSARRLSKSFTGSDGDASGTGIAEVKHVVAEVKNIHDKVEEIKDAKKELQPVIDAISRSSSSSSPGPSAKEATPRTPSSAGAATAAAPGLTVRSVAAGALA